MNHVEFWEVERASEDPNAWDLWIAKVEKSAGDLDSWADELSLIDHAYAAYRAGVLVNEYLNAVHNLTDIYVNAGPEDACAHMLVQYHEWRRSRQNGAA